MVAGHSVRRNRLRLAVVALLPIASELLFLPLATETKAQLPGPALTFRDSIVLEDDDDYFVSAPVDVAQGPDGSFLISDSNVGAVLHYGSDGDFVGMFGQRGRGPGELMGAGPLFATSDMVGVFDYPALELELFDYAGRDPIGATRVPVTMDIAAFAVVGDSVWLTSMDRQSWMTVGAVGQTELAQTAAQPYQSDDLFFGTYGYPFLDVGPSDISWDSRARRTSWSRTGH